jgi:hypothetical protein
MPASLDDVERVGVRAVSISDGALRARAETQSHVPSYNRQIVVRVVATLSMTSFELIVIRSPNNAQTIPPPPATGPPTIPHTR